MRRHIWLLPIAMALTACGGAADSGTSAVHAKSVIKAFEAGSVWCTEYDAASKTCTSVQTAERFTKNGVIVKVVTAEPKAIKTEYQTELTRIDNRLCRQDPEGRVLATLNSYHTNNALAQISQEDRSLKFSTLKEERELFESFRDTLIKDQNFLDKKETCWEYQKASLSADTRPQELVIVTYIDGVRQHYIPSKNRGTFLPPETKLALRSGTDQTIAKRAGAEEIGTP
ncbi:MAG: hypothetical protein ACRBEQ_09010 [Hyphomonas sp.]